MKIKWKEIGKADYRTIESWLCGQDKINLCMQTKNWEKTATDIGDCLELMDNSQFKNLIGFVDDQPVVAVMFGIEQIKVLNLYNIVVNPKYRNHGVAKNAIMQLVKNDASLEISKPYEKVVASTLPDNKNVQKLFERLGFDNLGYSGEYVVFENIAQNLNEITLW